MSLVHLLTGRGLRVSAYLTRNRQVTSVNTWLRHWEPDSHQRCCSCV